MSKPVDILVQSTRETLATQMNKLNSLLDTKEFNMLNFHLKSIYGSLMNRDEISQSMPMAMFLDSAKQQKLARICTRILDCRDPIGHSTLVHAIKLLSLLVKQLSQEPATNQATQATLKSVYPSLVKKLQPPGKEDKSVPDELQAFANQFLNLEQDKSLEKQNQMKLIGLAAYCFNRMNLKHILSPAEACKLIKDPILPLAARCLTMETKHKKGTFKQFESGYHDLNADRLNLETFTGNNDTDVLNRDSFHTYPLVVRLLVSLTERSSSFNQVLDSMLNEAVKTGKIKDEHIVALNVIAAQHERFTTGYPTKVAIDLLVKSEGLHRNHLAYITNCIFEQVSSKRSGDMSNLSGQIRRNPVADDPFITSFVTMMFEDLLTRTHDELLVEIALESLRCRQHEFTNWTELLKGKKILIARRLLEINSDPLVCTMFWRRFGYFTNTKDSAEFDELTRIRISQNTNKLEHLVSVNTRDNDQDGELQGYLEGLASLLWLRKHRLEPAQEKKLNELFYLMIDAKITSLQAPDPVIFLVRANGYRVEHKRVWDIIIKLLRLPEEFSQMPFKHHPGFVGNRLATQRLLAHFLILDTDYFYAEIGSAEVLELIFDHCRRAIGPSDSSDGNILRMALPSSWSDGKTLLKEILLTWPKDFRKTKLEAREYQRLRNMFIELHTDRFASEVAAQELIGKSTLNAEERTRIVDLLSGLVAVFSRHREAMFDVMDKMCFFQRGREECLRECIYFWSQLIINHADSSTSPLGTCFTRIELASILAAHEGLMMIRNERRFHQFPEFSATPKLLLDFIKSSCAEVIRREPVDSIVSKRCKEIKDSLPTA